LLNLNFFNKILDFEQYILNEAAQRDLILIIDENIYINFKKKFYNLVSKFIIHALNESKDEIIMKFIRRIVDEYRSHIYYSYKKYKILYFVKNREKLKEILIASNIYELFITVSFELIQFLESIGANNSNSYDNDNLNLKLYSTESTSKNDGYLDYLKALLIRIIDEFYLKDNKIMDDLFNPSNTYSRGQSFSTYTSNNNLTNLPNTPKKSTGPLFKKRNSNNMINETQSNVITDFTAVSSSTNNLSSITAFKVNDKKKNVILTIEEKYKILDKIIQDITLSPPIYRSLFLCVISKDTPENSFNFIKSKEKERSTEQSEQGFSTITLTINEQWQYFSYEAHQIIFNNIHRFCSYRFYPFIKLFLDVTKQKLSDLNNGIKNKILNGPIYIKFFISMLYNISMFEPQVTVEDIKSCIFSMITYSMGEIDTPFFYEVRIIVSYLT